MISLGNRIALVFSCTIAVAAVPSNLSGQTTARSAQRSTFWGTIALGQAGISDSGMIHSSIGLSVQRRHLLLTGRATGNQQGQKGDYRMRIKDAAYRRIRDDASSRGAFLNCRWPWHRARHRRKQHGRVPGRGAGIVALPAMGGARAAHFWRAELARQLRRHLPRAGRRSLALTTANRAPHRGPTA